MRDRILLRHHARRIAWGVGVFAAIILGLRIGWGLVAEARLRLVERRVAVATLSAVDVNPTRESPVGRLLALAQGFQPVTFRSPGALDLPWSAADEDSFRELAAANAGAIQELDALAGVDVPAWFVPLDVPARGMDNNFGERLRQVQEFCISGATLAHERGRDGEALAYLGRVLVLDRLMLAQPSIAAHSFTANARARLVGAIERISPTLQVNTPATRPSAGAATPDDARRLIAALLEERGFLEQMNRAVNWQIAALFGQQVAIDERPFILRSGDADLTHWVLRPVMTDERRRVLDAAPLWRDVTRAATFEAYRQHSPELSTNRISRVVMAGSNSFNGQWSRLAFAHYRALADGRAAAVLLAARLAAIDSGNVVGTAERFSPDYLPGPVADPFAADGRPLRYFADGSGVTVWSVGADGVDDGATVARTVRGRAMEQPDLVYGAGWSSGIHGPTTAPATVTAPKP